MKKIIVLIALSFIISGCNNLKNNTSISFIRLHPNVLYDPIGNPYLSIKQYVEYRFADSLYIGKSENDKNNEKRYSQFGLSKFYSQKMDKDFSDLMEKISNGNYKESYVRELGEFAIDDRHISILVINKNRIKKMIFYCEEELLPDDLKLATNWINKFATSVNNETTKPNYSSEIIAGVQDTLFKRLPPPKSTVEFISPEI